MEVEDNVSRTGLSGWNLTARIYSWTSGPLSHPLDSDLLSYLGNATEGAVVADCGCGPGMVSRRLVAKGAAKVCAIDVSSEMLEQVGEDPRIVTLQSTMEDLPLDKLRESEARDGFDLVLFKRSLYMNRSEALEVLKNAYGHLRPGGRIVVVHPEKKLGPYIFGSPLRLRRYTIPHLVNRTSNRLGVLLGVEKYALYTREELIALAGEVAGPERVELIPSTQQAFNLVAILRMADES